MARQPFVGITLATMLGVSIADWLPTSGAICIAIVVALAAVALLVRRSLATYAFIVAAFFFLHSNRIDHSAGQRLATRLGDETHAVIARGMVVSEPRISAGGSATFVFAIESLDLDGAAEPIRARVLTHWKHDVQFGDELALFGTAEPIPPPRNPGEFDMRAHLAREDITRQLIVRYAENGALVRHSLGNIVLRAAQHSRVWLHNTLTRGLEDAPDVQNLISGMALGLRHQTPENIEEPFQQTGTLHLFAVAGLHVGIVAQLLWIVAAVARVPRRTATMIIIPLLFFYAAVTGLHTSSLRAATMSAVLLAGFLFERKAPSLNSLAAAAFLILCWNTNELFAMGFQLSFAVVATILIVAGPAFRWLRTRLSFDPFLPRSLFTPAQRVGDKSLWWIARGTSVSFAAWLGSFPLMLWDYNLVTTISILSNLVVVPIAFFVLAGTLIATIAAPISVWFSVVFNNANWLLSRAIIGSVHFFAVLPLGHFYIEHPHRPSGARVEISALDVGTGAAIHIRSGTRDWMIDCGSRRDFERTTRAYLRARGVNRLDTLLLTHGDAAHIGGMPGLVEFFAPGKIVDRTADDRSRIHRAIVDHFRSDARYINCAAGERLPLTRDVVLSVLFPPNDFAADAADDQALVLRLDVPDAARILFMSDAGEPTEKMLLASGVDLRSDIIIKGQHRTGISATPAFIDAVQPKAIIATSRDFPESERIKDDWTQTLTARGIRLFRQDQTGAVSVRVFRHSYEIRSYLTSDFFRSDAR